MVPLETPRLLLQPLQLEDAQQTQKLFAKWEVVKYLNAQVPWPFPPDGALAHYRHNALPAIERGDEWHWTLRLKQFPDEIIGAIGLMRSASDPSQPSNNRGFWLAPRWHRQGLMLETVIAVNDYWFDVLGFPKLRVPKAVENLGSRRISEKTGMRVVATYESDYVSGRLLTEAWELTAEEWRVQRASLIGGSTATPRAEWRRQP